MNSKNEIFLKPRVQVSYLKIQNVLKPLYEGLNFIGRRKDATVIIENQNVSQYHAVITITNDKHYVSDTGSCNGSFLDKDKLQPLLLYELTEGSIIHFACVTAVYVKTPSNSQVVCAPQKNSQNLSESFFVAQTQQLEVEGVEEVFNNCFDDDYDFNDVATTQHVDTVVSIHDMPTQIFSSSHLKLIENCSPKTGSPSIHDLATQINIQQNNSCGIHDLATQINIQQNNSCDIHEMPTQIILSESNVENEISITTTNMHELATQFINLEKSINLITVKKSKEIEMHELATQINSADRTSIQKPQQDEEIEICSELNENENDSIKKNQEQNNLLNSVKSDDILCRPSTSKGFDNNADGIIDDDGSIGSPEPKHSMVNVSDDVIDDSFLGNVSEVGKNQEYLLLKSINKLTNVEQIPSQSPFQVSQPVEFSIIKKQCQPIVYSTSSSEKGNSPISDEVIVPGQTKKCLRINSDSDTDMEDLPPASNSEVKTNSKNNNKDDSGSDTDIGNNLNLIKSVTTKKVVRRRKRCRKIDSDSETDIENSNIEKFDSDSDTDIEDVPKISTSSPKKDKDFNITNSDSDTDIEKNETTQVVDPGSKITVREEQDSDIIPCTQLSDDDVDDFNFGIGKNSTVVEKNNVEDISENFSLRLSSYTELSEEVNNSKKIGVSVPTNEIQLNIGADSSNINKTDELVRTSTVVEKNNMEDISENFSLRLSAYTELSEEINNSKKIGVSVPTNEIQLNIGTDSSNINKTDELIIEEIQLATTKSTPEPPLALPTTSTLISDDLIAQPAQKIISEKESLFMQPTLPINIEKESDNIFVPPVQKSSSSSKETINQPTQLLSLDDDLFIQPTQKIIQTSKGEVSTSKNVFDEPTQLLVSDVNDDLFMQPTQKIVETSKDETREEHLFIIPTEPAGKIRSSSENVFDQPTQPLVSNENCDDDLFMQLTQKLPQNVRSRESVFDHPTQPLSLDDKVDDFFLQPTQKIGESSRPITFNEDNEDDLFLQPTQRIISTSDKEDLFDRPTQVLTIEDDLNGINDNDCDDLFFQPTQKVVSTTSKSKENKHLFDRPTQPLTVEKDLDDDLFLQPTQKVFSTTSKSKENEHLFDQPTQPLTVEKDLDDDLFLQPTQQITVVPKSKSPLKAFSDNSEKGTSVESQLEVMFASQPLLPQSNSRPSNPLVSILEGNYSIDSEDPESLCLVASEPVNQNEVSVKESLSSKQDKVSTKKQTKIGEKVVVKENVTVDNLVSNEDNKSNKWLRSTRRPSVDNFKLENDKMSTRKSQKIEKQEVKNKQSKNEKESSSGVTWKTTKQLDEDNENEVITRKQTRSREKVAAKDTVYNKNDWVSHEEKSIKQLRGTRKLSVDDTKVENDKMSTRRNQKIDSEKIEGSKKEKECRSGVILKKTEHSKQSNDDNENNVIVKASLNFKEDEVITRSREKVVAKEDVTVGNKNKLASNQEEKSTEQLDTDTKVENDKISTRKSRRTDSIKSSKIIQEQEVLLNKQSKTEKKDSSGGSQKKTEQSNEDENERVKVQENKDDNASQETKINTRKRTTRSGSVDSENTAKIVKKNKNNDKCEISDQTGIIKSSSRLRNLKKDPNKLNDIQEIVGTSKEVVKSDTVKPSTVTRSTRGARKNLNSEQPLNDSVMTISSDNSDDDIILNKPRITKRKQESQTSSVGSKKIKTVESSPENAPIAKKGKKIASESFAADEPVNQSDLSNSNSSNSSLRTPIRSRRLSSVSSINDTPNRNKRKQKPKIVFTMLDSPELESLIRSLGGLVVDTVNACTVLVTGSLKRSQKLLSAVGQAKPICSVKWLQECKKMSTFLDPWDFILEDEEAETKWNFSLKESLIRSQNQKLLENYSILVLVTTAVDVLKAAIESCGGKCVSRAPADTKSFIVVASPENKRKYAKFIKQKVTIVSPEAIFDGVLRQELRFKDHLLS